MKYVAPRAVSRGGRCGSREPMRGRRDPFICSIPFNASAGCGGRRPAWSNAAGCWTRRLPKAGNPSRRRFGAAQFADDYLVLQLGDNPVGANRARVTATFSMQELADASSPDGGSPPSLARRVWRKMSLTALRPEEQLWVKFLLVLP